MEHLIAVVEPGQDEAEITQAEFGGESPTHRVEIRGMPGTARKAMARIALNSWKKNLFPTSQLKAPARILITVSE